MPTAAQLYSAMDLFQMPATERYELVKGELVPMPPPPGWMHGNTTGRLSTLVGYFVMQQGLGECFAAETGFRIETDPDTVLAPDFAFVSRDRLPQAAGTGYLSLAPDIVAETRSPSDTDREVAYKIGLWLMHGTQVVWEIDPQKRVVRIHKSGQQPVTLTGDDDSLHEADLLPGWSVQVSQLFP